MNVAKLIKIKRNPTFESNPPFLDTMFFEIDNTSTTIATTGGSKTTVTTTTTTTTKKQSFISRRQIFIQPSSPLPSVSSLTKRRPLLQKHHSHSSTSTTNSGRFAELAGGTTAECAAICCCCPCGLVNLLYLTIYKVPAGLCRRALRRKRGKQLIKKGLLPPKRCRCGCDETEIQIHPSVADMIKFDEEDTDEDDDDEDDDVVVVDEEEDAMMKLEKEMWETFYSTGFWRSPSQRETTSTLMIQDSSKPKVHPL